MQMVEKERDRIVFGQTIHREFLRHVRESPKLIVREFLSEKLAEKNIEDDALLDALTDHIMAFKDSDFEWEEEKYSNVSLSITDVDVEEIMRRVKSFVQEGIPKVVHSTMHESAADLLKSLENTWPERRIWEKSEEWGFSERLHLRWGKALDALRMLLTISRELGEAYIEKLLRSKAKTGLLKREALSVLHQRACQTTLEIIVLLENGLADGAFARWRTLYEITVVSQLLDQYDDDLAERYFNHDTVASMREIENAVRLSGSLKEAGISKSAAAQVQRDFKEVLSEYGDEFKTPYGWASQVLLKKRPTFQDLETAVGRPGLPQSYKQASYKVHAGVTGSSNHLGLMNTAPRAMCGASNAGLETPIARTAQALTQVNVLLFGNSKIIDIQTNMMMVVKLSEKAAKEAQKAARKLANDELNLQKEMEEEEDHDS